MSCGSEDQQQTNILVLILLNYFLYFAEESFVLLIELVTDTAELVFTLITTLQTYLFGRRKLTFDSNLNKWYGMFNDTGYFMG